MKQRLLFLSFFLLPIISFADSVTVGKPKVQSWHNTSCKDQNECGLQSFQLHYAQYQVHFDAPLKYPYSLGDRIYAEYTTKKTEELERFAIVQFVRGCMFYSHLEKGLIKKDLTIYREFFDEIVPFVHRDWVIDSVDQDPMYNNIPKGSESQFQNPTRHALYRWTQTKNAFEDKTEKLLGQKKPLQARLYVVDRPGTAFVSESGEAKNISLEFKTCVYKTSDIPLEVSSPAAQSLLSQPLHCFDWRSSYIFNFETKTFESPQIIDPICNTQ